MSKIKWCPVEGCELPAPSVATEGSAGFDLRVNQAVSMAPCESQMVGTGYRVAIPQGFVGLIFPRSSLGRRGLCLANTVGVIDADYRGEIRLALEWFPEDGSNLEINPGQRIVQMVVVPCLTESEVGPLDDTDRGDGGFGHTGAD